MAGFKVVLIEHGYATTRYERELIEAAGGEFIDADRLPVDEALARCEDADGILCRRLPVPRTTLQGFRCCRILVRYGVGTDNVDVDAAQEELQRTAAEEIVRVCTGGLPRSLANPLVLKQLGRWDEWEPPEHVRWQLTRLEKRAASVRR